MSQNGEYIMLFSEEIVTPIRKRYESMKPFLTDERLRRRWAASEAQMLGHGGLKVLRTER